MSCDCKSISVGKLQRANPLPAGDYWIDVIGEEAKIAFQAWSFENQNSVLILVTESFESQGGFPARDWIKFQTKAPLPWDAKVLGFPNIIEDGDNIDSSSDTAQNPSNEELGICDIQCQAKKAAIIAGGVLAVGFLLIMVKR